nr:MAG TPA: hypothetical protein [Caudoviricetes sp.]DAH87079.1 MAG TPA: hypothetical protein [Caudoviricetes sp.]
MTSTDTQGLGENSEKEGNEGPDNPQASRADARMAVW